MVVNEESFGLELLFGHMKHFEDNALGNGKWVHHK